MTISINRMEILETIKMVQADNLDVRTITMGISLRDCCHSDAKIATQKVYDKICKKAENLVSVGEAIGRDFGIPIVNKRISVTPMAMIAESSDTEDYVCFAKAMDDAAREVGVNFIG
ncbi:MAG: DUF711 family protein, partial [Clostridiales bacterium]